MEGKQARRQQRGRKQTGKLSPQTLGEVVIVQSEQTALCKVNMHHCCLPAPYHVVTCLSLYHVAARLPPATDVVAAGSR